jgi:HAD superfamily hydrolase (TIGR01484 family)
MKKRLIVFDVDGTLCESRKQADIEMINLLNELSHSYDVALFSGADKERIQTQVASQLSFVPFIGEYSSARITLDMEVICDKKLDMEDISIIKHRFGLINTNPKSLLDIRPYQITYYIVNPEFATDKERNTADPTTTLRRNIIKQLDLTDYNVRIGGKTSIDVNLKNVSKRHGVDVLKKHLKLKDSEILFIGDRCFKGGNDYMEDIYESKQVTGPRHTKQIIRRLLE